MTDFSNIITNLENSGYSAIPTDTGLFEKITLLKKACIDLFTSNHEISQVITHGFIAGYRDVGVEYSQHPSRPDLMKAISLPISYLRNIHEVENFSFESLFSSVGFALFQIAKTISFQLGTRYGGLGSSNFSCEDSSFFQTSYYQPNIHQRETLQDIHEDGNLFTLVWASAPGLEIVKENFSIPIDFHNSDIYIMPGKILSLLTGNKIKACDHVVKRHQNQKDRISFMCFVNPSVKAPIIPWIKNDYNQGKDIRQEIQHHSVKFGLPAIT